MGNTVFLKHFKVVNIDEKTTQFMMTEFSFITQTSLPSLEYDVCRDHDKYLQNLQRKLGPVANN